MRLFLATVSERLSKTIYVQYKCARVIIDINFCISAKTNVPKIAQHAIYACTSEIAWHRMRPVS